MTAVKGILIGTVLSWTLSLILGAVGAGWGYLNIHMVHFSVHLGPIDTIHYNWSWPMFFAFSGIAWGILMMME